MSRGFLTGASGITSDFLDDVEARLRTGGRVRRRLPGGGRLHMDRRLPFLVVHRVADDDGARAIAPLVTGEAAYLVGPADPAHHGALLQLVERIAGVMTEQFGAFLLLELWEAGGTTAGDAPPSERPVRRATFRIVTPTLPRDDSTVQTLHRALAEIPLRPPPLDVDVDEGAPARPSTLPPLLTPGSAAPGLSALGIEVQPLYRQASEGGLYPVLFETLRRGLSVAFRQTAFHFAITHTTHAPPHFHALGRRVAARAAAAVDRELAEIARSFDFLLQVTPVNASGARARFLRASPDERVDPVFDYRPLAVDVDLMKRRLYEQRIEELEDPTLGHLLRDSRDALDRTLTMLADRNTPRFLYGSLALYGTVEPDLLRLALEILRRLHPDSRDDLADGAPAEGGPTGNGEPAPGALVDAEAFARRAEKEIAHYRALHPQVAARVHVRGDVTGLLVSRGDLLVGARLQVPVHRAEALIQHEVGTHVLTYYNGLAQPLEQLALGLAGYEELQEGLGVLAEHLVGGLTPGRLRLLAGRVIAVQRLVDGAAFVETFRELTASHGFAPGAAFTTCMRVYRSGGLTKDVLYLRGLAGLVAHLRDGGDLEVLYTGKIALRHQPVIEELRWREYLRPAPLRPRHLSAPGAAERLAALRSRGSILSLVSELRP